MVLSKQHKNRIEESMKTITILLAVALVFGAAYQSWCQVQGLSPAERKQLRSYTSPDELVSIAPTTPMDGALDAISEVSQKFVGKIIIDTERRNMPINVDIQGLHWRDALETILRKNDLWYTEYENYIQISSMGGDMAAGMGTGGEVSYEIPREVVSFRSREVKISAVFFAVNLTRLEEVGMNWNFSKTVSTGGGTVSLGSNFAGADQVTQDIFNLQVTPNVSFANMDFLLRLFSDYKLGEILSGPQLTVRSGEKGRIQIGEDFSIRERDFAGNLIDRFYSTGVIIDVTPQVITEQGVDFVHLNVEVERSTVQPGQVSTIVSKANAQTNLLLLDEEETIIGGLYEKTVNTTRQGVPFLKDLPWYVLGLRYIFGYDKDEEEKTELIILMKAELVPTLQERITQKATGEELIEKWREDVSGRADRLLEQHK
jgi:type IV pilus assembly protein PilQ